MFLSLLIYFGFFLITESKFYKNNITDFSKCQVYYSKSGNVYKDFFEISDNFYNNGSLLDFHFSVLASSDAHILLAPSSQLESDDPVYEIVIGAGGNTFCDIRRMQKSLVKASTRIKGLLSALDIKSFWLHISKDGIIELGRDGEELAFLFWTDPDPLPLKVFSFSTWPGIEAKWFFDCPRENISTVHSKEIMRNLTSLEKLRKDLLLYYDPYVRPVKNLSTITVVHLAFRTYHVSLDEYKSAFTYTGEVKMQWIDEKMKWNPSNYSNISELHIFRREIWVPNLYLFNSVVDGGDILEDSLMIINSSGFVNWTPKINLESWCNPDDLGKWPKDTHKCKLILGCRADFENVQLIFDGNNSIFITPISSSWKILEVETLYHKGSGWSNATRKLINIEPSSLQIYYKLSRISNAYNTIFYAPYFFIATCLLLSFWVSPFSYLKISLSSLQLVVSSLVLITLGILIPVRSQFVPNLVLLYSYCLIASLVSVIIAILVINLSRNVKNYGLPHSLEKLLLSTPSKLIFFLPNLKSPEEYGNLNESFSKLNEKYQVLWILVGVVLDRIAFLTFLFLTVYAFYICY